MAGAGLKIARYELFEAIGSGGMGSVHLARVRGPLGFARVVAAKRLHPHLARDAEFLSMLLLEAKVGAGLHHPCIVPVLDVVPLDDEWIIVLDYVCGASLAEIAKRSRGRKSRIPCGVISGWLVDLLEGLHAAHSAQDNSGRPHGIVHRDVSPHNVLVGRDGRARLTDFGVAKVAARATSSLGHFKGKVGYVAPEQLLGKPVGVPADLFSVGVIGWELLAMQKLIDAREVHEAIRATEALDFPPTFESEAPELVVVLRKALSRQPEDRFPTARQMAEAIANACPPLPAFHAAKSLDDLASDLLSVRSQRMQGLLEDQEAETTTRTDLLTEVDKGHSVSGRSATTARSNKSATWPRGLLVAGVSLALGFAGARCSVGSTSIAGPRVEPSAPELRPVATATPGTSSIAIGADAPSAQLPPGPSAVPPPIDAAPSPTVALRPPASVATGRTSPVATTKPPPPTRGDCSPPYVINSAGVRTYKVHCLQ